MSKHNDSQGVNRISDYYVYVYKDLKGQIQYAGYGKKLDRPTSRNRSDSMIEFLSKGKYMLEVAGPYGSKEIAISVETALISLLHPPLNNIKAPGPTRLQFRPLGIPEKFAERLSEPRLTEHDFTTINQGKACPLLFVFISDKNFEGEDARPGYPLDKPLSDADILARMERWWQIGRYIETWKMNPQQSPKTLIALTGPRAHRIIIGAVAIDQKGWSSSQPEQNKLYRIPTLATSNLDAHGLRGRILSPNISIKFGAITTQFFVMLGCDGRTIGGQQ